MGACVTLCEAMKYLLEIWRSCRPRHSVVVVGLGLENADVVVAAVLVVSARVDAQRACVDGSVPGGRIEYLHK